MKHVDKYSQTLRTYFILIQVRSKLSTFGGFGGPTEVTCGGNALKFYASMRLNIRRTGLVKKGEEVLISMDSVNIHLHALSLPFGGWCW